MTVYVDELRHSSDRPPFHRGSCHLTADTIEELHELASRIGLKREWYQPLSWPHYDLTASKRALAIEAGAVFVPGKQLATVRLAARKEAFARLGPGAQPIELVLLAVRIAEEMTAKGGAL